MATAAPVPIQAPLRARLSHRFRSARARHVIEVIDAIHARKGSVELLDIGGEEAYWTVFPPGYLAARRVRITLLNKQRLPEGRFRRVVGDACSVDQANMSFDLVHSNSVIEHVGSDARMAAFAQEVRRLAPSYFVQTPSFWFPYEPHLRLPIVHWLPQRVQVEIAFRMQRNPTGLLPDRLAARYYLDANRQLTAHSLRRLFPDAELRTERLAGWPKSIMAIRV